MIVYHFSKLENLEKILASKTLRLNHAKLKTDSNYQDDFSLTCETFNKLLGKIDYDKIIYNNKILSKEEFQRICKAKVNTELFVQEDLYFACASTDNKPLNLYGEIRRHYIPLDLDILRKAGSFLMNQNVIYGEDDPYLSQGVYNLISWSYEKIEFSEKQFNIKRQYDYNEILTRCFFYLKLFYKPNNKTNHSYAEEKEMRILFDYNLYRNHKINGVSHINPNDLFFISSSTIERYIKNISSIKTNIYDVKQADYLELDLSKFKNLNLKIEKATA